MYRASFTAINTDSLNMRMAIKMTMGEWKELRDQMAQAKWPAVELISSITKMINKAEAEFNSTGGDDEPDSD